MSVMKFTTWMKLQEYKTSVDSDMPRNTSDDGVEEAKKRRNILQKMGGALLKKGKETGGYIKKKSIQAKDKAVATAKQMDTPKEMWDKTKMSSAVGRTATGNPYGSGAVGVGDLAKYPGGAGGRESGEGGPSSGTHDPETGTGVPKSTQARIDREEEKAEQKAAHLADVQSTNTERQKDRESRERERKQEQDSQRQSGYQQTLRKVYQ